MTEQSTLKLLFIINPISGSNTTDWALVITDYFKNLKHFYAIHHFTKKCSIQTIKAKISEFSPQIVAAVGCNGTIKLVAECLIQTNIVLGIIPAGSANGLAKELGISNNPSEALDTIIKGFSKNIHITNINDQLCIHLSDIGLNAYAMKKFKTQHGRGMWGYFITSLKVLWQNPMMEISMKIDGKSIKMKAEMIVIANGREYGTGAVINPEGKLNDELFEVIVIKQISVIEIFKMIFSHSPYDTAKTEIFQTLSISMRSKKKVHFQIDGEYLGKVNEVKAILIPDALQVIVPNV